MSSESDLSVAEKVQTAQDVPRSNGDAELQMHRTRSSGIYPQLPIAGEHNMSKLKFALFLVGVYSTTFLYGLDTTIAADVQGAVLESLGEIQKLPWIGIGFPLGSSATVLLVGKLYGTFNIKYVYIVSILLFEIGSALCGAAQDMDMLIVGRVIAGIGGAGVYLGSLNYISIFSTPAQASLLISLIASCWGLGLILGPLIGGGFSVSGATWRWAFYINLVICAVTAPIYIFCFPHFDPQKDKSAKQRARELDWLGAFLTMASLTLFVLVVSFAGAQWTWDFGGTIAVWVVWGVVFALTCIQQVYCIGTDLAHRVFPVQYLKSSKLLLLFFSNAASGAALFVPLYYIPLLFEFTKGDSAVLAAVRLLPYVFLLMFAIISVGITLPKWGRYSVFFVIGGCLTIAGFACLMTITPSTSISAVYGYEVLCALGTGVAGWIGYSVAGAAVPPQEIADSIGFLNIAQLGGVTLCLTISGAIFQNTGLINLRNALESYNFSGEELRGALAGVQSVILQHEGPIVRDLALAAIVKTIATIFCLGVVGAGVILLSGLALGFLLKWEKVQLEQGVAAG